MRDLGITESHVEEAALEWFEALEWSVLCHSDSAAGDQR